jgi:hypothetical protein
MAQGCLAKQLREAPERSAESELNLIKTVCSRDVSLSEVEVVEIASEYVRNAPTVAKDLDWLLQLGDNYSSRQPRERSRGRFTDAA